MKHLLSRYTLRYPRSLVYMLQASEYHIGEYLTWYHKTTDFTQVERRKTFEKTTKGVALLVTAWVIVLLLLGTAIALPFISPSPVSYLLSLCIVLLSPSLLAYAILVPLFIGKILIQRPIEFLIIRKARQTLKKHRAIKIGIAGSYGKTTMREILKTVLSEGKRVAAPPHSYNTLLGISQFVQTLQGDEEVLIFELGEYYPGDIRTLCELVQPDMGVITGVNEAHLEKFKSIERTAETIYELADALGNKPVYVNGENELAQKNARAGYTLYTRKSVGDWSIADQSTSLQGTTFTLSTDTESIELKSTLLGLHQIGPLAVAVKIAQSLGLSAEQLQRGIAKTTPFDHRLEPKIDASGVITLDDSYNGNPDGVKMIIEFLSSLQNYRRWYVTPGLVEMGAKIQEVHTQIGREIAKAHIEKVVLIKNSVTPFIEEGLRKEGYTGDVFWFDDALTAYASLPQLTVKGDVVLLQNDWPDQYH